jgi:hypothetical protein
MQRRAQAFLAVGVYLVSFAAAAEEPEVSTEPTEPTEPTGPAQPEAHPEQAVAEPPPPPAPPPSSWRTEITGYFRAPVSLGVSSRPGPDTPMGPDKTQISYGPNRAFDWNYYSFAYTRLQEQDWAELFVHERKKHVDAAVGWMGYWYQGAGFRNPDAAWLPAIGYLTLDTDFKAIGLNPNVAFTVGAWWPKFGYVEKYDTYTLGRFRQIGEQLRLAIPFSHDDFTLAVVEGFGTSRDGSYNFTLQNISPLYAATTAIDLIAWVNIQLLYKKYVDVSLHINTEWTADPNLEQQGVVNDKSYQAASAAHLSVVGAEATLDLPYAGRLWLSPSFISVKNGWALGNGTEVMHSLGGVGVATNYLAWSGSPTDSTGSGSMVNLGWLAETSLSRLRGGKPLGGGAPRDLKLSFFGLYTSASLVLPSMTTLKQDKIRQLKYGLDVTLQALDWLAFMVRGDLVNYDMDNPGFPFAALTGRVQFASHFLSSERIYIQYSRYIYGDKVLLNATWPWGTSLVAGSSVIQEGPYSGMKPDANIIKLQSEIAF